MTIRNRNKKGLICFREGEVVHAETDGQSGEEAFFSVLSWDSGYFECDGEKWDSDTIRENWDFLLMESMRRLDNTRRQSEDR